VSKSTQNKSRQQEWQKRFLEMAVPPVVNISTEHTEESFHHALWVNTLNPNSLRLTQGGYEWVVKACKQTAYVFVTTYVSNGALVKLDHLMTAPYYVRNRYHLHLFNEEDAIMLNLHSGNLDRYLKDLDS
jgi:hypothetical protein